MAALPDDTVAVILGVLPPRNLAVARCVCKAWRDIVDSRALLLPQLLPNSVRGVFCNYIDHDRPHLFARPSSSSSTFPRIDGLLSFLPNDHRRDWWTALDHCNGLLLCNIEWERQLVVCNPATKRWALLPMIREATREYSCAYIAFDPIVSPHYQVFLIPDVLGLPEVKEEKEQDINPPFCLDWFFSLPPGALPTADQTEEEDQHLSESLMESEWPPSQWSLKVFSSRTGLWEDRSFVRQGQPAGTVQDTLLDPDKSTWLGPRQRYAVYHNGGLYVHCQGSFMARFSLSNDKYQVIEMPTKDKGAKPYLGRSNNEVYFGIVDDACQLHVWKLSESRGHMTWLLKYKADLGPYADHVASIPYNDDGRQLDGSWMVEEKNYVSDTNSNIITEREGCAECDPNSDEYNADASDNDEYNADASDNDDNTETKSEESSEWDSDKDGVFTVEDGDEDECKGRFDILGFHPHKDIVFLVALYGVASYHLNNSKIQYLGNSRPKCYKSNHGIYESFIYTPCMIGDPLDEVTCESFEL